MYAVWEPSSGDGSHPLVLMTDKSPPSRREIKEETGITKLKLIKPLGSYQRTSLDENPEEKTIVLFLYKTEEIKAQPKAADSIETKWIDVRAVAELLSHPKDAEYFRDLQADILAPCS